MFLLLWRGLLFWKYFEMQLCIAIKPEWNFYHHLHIVCSMGLLFISANVIYWIVFGSFSLSIMLYSLEFLLRNFHTQSMRTVKKSATCLNGNLECWWSNPSQKVILHSQGLFSPRAAQQNKSTKKSTHTAKTLSHRSANGHTHREGVQAMFVFAGSETPLHPIHTKCFYHTPIHLFKLH